MGVGRDRWKNEGSIIICGQGGLPEGLCSLRELGRDGSGTSWVGTSWKVMESLRTEARVSSVCDTPGQTRPSR